MDDHIPFAPTDNDVVSTKLRTWNLKHPGNLFYTDLVQKMVSSISGEDVNVYRLVAEQIVQIIGNRGGRFLKLKDGDMTQTHCTIMNKRQCISKVAHALRTAQSRQENRDSGKVDNQHSGKKKKKTSPKANTVPTKARDSTSPRARGRRSLSGVMYQAEAGTQQAIPKYMLDVVSIVCNQDDLKTAHRALDTPISGRTHQTESDKERLMRLNIRQRFASASSIGMSPYEFATKLLKLWGGKLVTITKTPTKIATPASYKGRSSAPPTQSPTKPFVGVPTIEQNNSSTKVSAPAVLQGPASTMVTNFGSSVGLVPHPQTQQDSESNQKISQTQSTVITQQKVLAPMLASGQGSTPQTSKVQAMDPQEP